MLAFALFLAAAPAWSLSLDSFTEVLPWKGYVSIRSDGDVKRTDNHGRQTHRIVGGAALTHLAQELAALHDTTCPAGPENIIGVPPFNPRVNVVTITVAGDTPWVLRCRWRMKAPPALNGLLAAVAEIERVVPEAED